jgi:hypothetical protein
MPYLTGIAVAANKDEHLELVAISGREGPEGLVSPGRVWHARQTASGDWTGWESLGQPGGGVSRGRPTIACAADGRFRTVVIADDGGVWLRSQIAPNSQDWIAWQSLDRPGGQNATGTPVLGQNKDGRLEVFVVRGSDQTVWHAQQEPERAWSAWESLDKPSGGAAGKGALAVAQSADGRLEFFMGFQEGSTQAVWHRWQRQEGGWSDWASLGAPTVSGAELTPGKPVVARAPDGHLYLFTVASDGAVWHRQQSPAASGGWKNWHKIGPGLVEVEQVGVGIDTQVVGHDALLLVATSREYRLWQMRLTAADPHWSSFGTSS